MCMYKFLGPSTPERVVMGMFRFWWKVPIHPVTKCKPGYCMGKTTHQLKQNMCVCVCLNKSGISIEWLVTWKNYIQTNLSESKWGLNGFILLTEKWRFHQENTWASGFKQLRLVIFQWFVCTNKSTKKGAGVQTTMTTSDQGVNTCFLGVDQ